MSSNPSDGLQSNEYDMDIENGFRVVGIVFAFLVVMVLLRFGVNMCIDAAVLRDQDSLMRTIGEFRRKICPWWRPRTQPAQPPETQLVTMDQLVRGLNAEQKKELFSTILQSKVVTSDDIAEWRCDKRAISPQQMEEGQPSKKHDEKHNDSDAKNSKDKTHDDDDNDHSMQDNDDASHQHNSTNDHSSRCSQGLLCSICLHDIDAGNRATSLAVCGHVFHQECISQWLCLDRGSRDCPYCRTEIISQQMMEDAYRRRQQQQNGSSSDP
mmetsp:Transcript_23580/g.65850  ORF Transcript_23580/g.65850 Transcript_23580/m.65850 type:complete len:268 (-) Transcript_23580:168-971(-)|eukprot:CAMPEP_0198114826 /NCGR_PEP_ID=MMETSP1442-20131203/6094_1 /TAXON_ID= /ORGANISM="Craspedostauros australis, Strain CCMP3328" /LENGTH=267 /DNA_ID=CAMNT_0043772221 /DNA_START=238 /DNA_END=1041 /DNA_ORIENTATION=-